MDTKRLYVDFHVLQTVPPSCVNRDDTGSPKTAVYGGGRFYRWRGRPCPGVLAGVEARHARDVHRGNEWRGGDWQAHVKGN